MAVDLAGGDVEGGGGFGDGQAGEVPQLDDLGQGRVALLEAAEALVEVEEVVTTR